jgi:IS30 family transposase
LRAERRAVGCATRSKAGKLSGSPRLRAAVQQGLDERWSPQQISARLQAEFPDDLEMRISHETIYQSLYVQSRGELRRQITGDLRSGRVKRRPRGGQLGQRGKIRDMVLISERPAQIADRAVPGHWEGDLLVGKQGKSYIATLVERHTRYVLLARLGNQRTTDHVVDALITRIGELPDHLVRSLTWDQGNELAAHKWTSPASVDRGWLGGLGHRCRSQLDLGGGREPRSGESRSVLAQSAVLEVDG